MLCNVHAMLTAAVMHTVMARPLEGQNTETLRTSDFHTADLHAVHKTCNSCHTAGLGVLRGRECVGGV